MHVKKVVIKTILNKIQIPEPSLLQFPLFRACSETEKLDYFLENFLQRKKKIKVLYSNRQNFQLEIRKHDFPIFRFSTMLDKLPNDVFQLFHSLILQIENVVLHLFSNPKQDSPKYPFIFP